MEILTTFAMLGAIIFLALLRSSVWGWLLTLTIFVCIAFIQSRASSSLFQAITILLIPIAAVMCIPRLRRPLVTHLILKKFRQALPHISQTEQDALDTGTVWWDGDLFSGHPNWQKLLHYPKATLNPTEQSFLDNETESLCAMLDDWDITHVRYDLPLVVWEYIKKNGFLGMIIPKEHGGLGFSACAHSAVIVKIASRSITASVTVMVPNSLGPAELLIRYGTSSQKDQYLRRLAHGEDIPCFALTGPFAGSDAGSIPDYGIVCHGEFNGQSNVLGMRVTWDKRYITLAPVATLLGLAFKLYDPDHLLGQEKNLGITIALIPTSTPGVQIGRRHFPLNSAFQNGPTSGDDVFIPMEYIIGGVSRIGQGWRMLMECLATGRSISLPASATGGIKLAARTSGAYSRVRKQFKLPIGKFEGVEEALARIGGNAYSTDAVRMLTVVALDMGETPSVISAIAKYHCTERARKVVNDAMDVHGGKGICLGPRNYLGRAHQQNPIAITVEGANILTRSLLIFGQGAIRSHPYVLQEIRAAKDSDEERAVRNFDIALFGHIGLSLSNAIRAYFFGLTDGRGLSVPAGKETWRYYQQLTRYSAAFAFTADVTMLTLGGNLKRCEKISARLGDILSQLYLCSATLKRFEDDGRPSEDLPLLDWAIQDALHNMQLAFDGVFNNFPNRFYALLLRAFIFPLGKSLTPPSDKLGGKVSALLLHPSATRDRLTAGMYLPKNEIDPVGPLEAALHSTLKCESLQQQISAMNIVDPITISNELAHITAAHRKGLITTAETQLLERDYELRLRVIMVDDFTPDQLISKPDTA